MKFILLVFALTGDGQFVGWTPAIHPTREACEWTRSQVEAMPSELRFVDPDTGKGLPESEIEVWNARCVPLVPGATETGIEA